VLACGGGVVEREPYVEQLRVAGLVIWLDLPWERVLTRLRDTSAAERPLLGSLTPAELEALYRRRQRLYARAAHFRLQVGQDDPELLARQVLASRLAWGRRMERRTP
jgi:shikimate kinase